MEDYFISKSEGDGLETEEVIHIFNSAENLDEIKSAVEKSKERIWASFASVDVRDKDGELIPIQDVINTQDLLMQNGGTITDNHTNRVIGKTISYRVMPHPANGKKGVLHLNKLYYGMKLYDKVWKELQSGERTGSSVGGEHEKSSFINLDGMPTKVLEGFKQYETGSVFNPANQLSLNQAVSMVAKSESSKSPHFFMTWAGNIYELLEVNKNFSSSLISEKEETKKPKEVEDMVAGILSNPDFKPIPGKTREESAYAIAYSKLNKKAENCEKPENTQYDTQDKVLNKEEQDSVLTHKGDEQVEEKKNENPSLDVAMQKMAAGEALSKEEYAMIKEKADSCFKQEEEEVVVPAEEKPAEEKPTEEKKSDIKQSQPSTPAPSDPNDLDALKSDIASLKSEIAKMSGSIKKQATVTSPRPSAEVKKEEVKKGIDAFSLALGGVKTDWNSIQERF